VIDKIISVNQYLTGRQLVDELVAVNEVVDLGNKSKQDCLIFQVDFEKPYDSVSWSFLEIR